MMTSLPGLGSRLFLSQLSFEHLEILDTFFPLLPKSMKITLESEVCIRLFYVIYIYICIIYIRVLRCGAIAAGALNKTWQSGTTL